jgi:NAD(P)-dependent dehydrogenase (short-subunit alcohol dehydrogenase family)
MEVRPAENEFGRPSRTTAYRATLVIDTPEDIAEAVALLVSDRAKFITGANYRVDGGMTGA